MSAPAPLEEPLPAPLRSGPDWPALAAELRDAVEREAIHHGSGERNHPFHFDPVPRVLAAEDAERLRTGLAQRVRALEAFAADAHGPREAVRAGVLPEDVITSSRYLHPELPRPRAYIGIAGPDVVRNGDGALVVLEDNVRTPTMMAYAATIRRLTAGRLAGHPGPLEAELRDWTLRVLRAAAPDAEEPSVAILTEGPANALAWEVEALGRLLGVPVVKPGDLTRRGDRLLHRGRPVDVLWRRTSEERLRDDAGRLNALGELLDGPLRADGVQVVNALGSGVADDKRTYPYVEDLVRFFCGEEPVLRSIPAYDLGREEVRRGVLPRLGELVLKPRAGSGGFGVLIGPRAGREQLARARAAVEADPGNFIAQEPVAISTHPTVVDGGLAPRHADVRPFALHDGEEVHVLAGALSRFSLAEGDLVVNASQGGGGKDTWFPA